MRKFLPNNFTGSFTVMRQKIEKLVDDGYTFLKWEERQSEANKQNENRVLKSPLEIRFEEREQEKAEEERMAMLKRPVPVKEEEKVPMHKRKKLEATLSNADNSPDLSKQDTKKEASKKGNAKSRILTFDENTQK